MKHVYAVVLLVFVAASHSHAQFIADNRVASPTGEVSGNSNGPLVCPLGPAPAAPWHKQADQVFGHIRGSLLAKLKNTSEGIVSLFHDSVLTEGTFNPVWHGEYFSAGKGAPQLRFGVSCAFHNGDGDPNLAGDLTIWAMAVRELRRHDMLSALRPGLLGTARRLPGSWDFVWTTNIAHSVYAAWGPISNVIVGAMLGPAAAGLFKIAGTIADSAGKPADLLARGFYPEIMRLDPASKRPWRLALRTGLIAAAIGALVLLVVFVGGKPVIGFVFGHKYLVAFGLLQIMTAALILEMGTFPLESLLYMVGRQRAALVAQLTSALIYCVALVVFSHLWGLTGAGIAFLLGTLATAVCMLIPTLQSYRRRAVYGRPVSPAETPA